MTTTCAKCGAVWEDRGRGVLELIRAVAPSDCKDCPVVSRPPTEPEASAYKLGHNEGVRECIAAVDVLHGFVAGGAAGMSLTDDGANLLLVLRRRLLRLLP